MISSLKILSRSRKRGSSPSTVVAFIATMFGVALIVLLSGLINIEVMDAFKSNSPVWDSDMENVSNRVKWVYHVFDKVVVVLAFVLLWGIIATSKRLATRRVFFMVVFLLSAVMVFMGYLMSYVFSQMVSNAAFNKITAYLPLTILITTNMHWFVIVVIFISSILLYGKKEQGQFLTIEE